MKKIFRIIVEITVDALNNIKYFIESNLRNFAKALNIVLPFMMYFIGKFVVVDRNNTAIGGEIFVPFVFFVIIYYLKSTANRLGKGITVPIPNERFTKTEDDGEVTIEYSRIQELILYVADVEDWLERKGLL